MHVAAAAAARGTHGLRITIAAAAAAIALREQVDGGGGGRTALARSLGVLLRTNWRVRTYKFPQTGTLNRRTHCSATDRDGALSGAQALYTDFWRLEVYLSETGPKQRCAFNVADKRTLVSLQTDASAVMDQTLERGAHKEMYAG